MDELKPGRYRHFKGNEYRLLYVAKHSEALDGEGGIWVRPAEMWSEEVDREGYRGPRFTYVGE